MMLTMISTPNWIAISTFCMRSDTTMPRALTQRHRDDEERAEQHLGEQVLGEVVEAEELEQVDRGDLGDVGQHDDRRDGQAPAADPPDPRPERLGAPRERGAAVGCVLRQLLVGEATSSIGMNASTNIDGDFSPTASTTKPSVAARL